MAQDWNGDERGQNRGQGSDRDFGEAWQVGGNRDKDCQRGRGQGRQQDRNFGFCSGSGSDNGGKTAGLFIPTQTSA